MARRRNLAAGTGNYLDERLSLATIARANLRKAFPDHWSFLLGEIALYSFIVLLLTGTYLTLFFKPSMTEVVYQGSYVPLKGVKMSEAYASTLDISFDVRGGLLMRQVHHWAALIFVMAIVVHMMRIFFTGAFRKPREFNWLIGNALLTLAILEGFAGYSLPDDLLSGTGLRIASGVLLSIPVVGTYLHMFVFGGEFPGDDFIPRLFTVHILLVPGIMLALITVHVLLVFYQKHTHWPGPGRTNANVVGLPLLPVYVAKAGGFFFVVFGLCAFLGGISQINPVWLFGPYSPIQVSAGSQPDFYMGWLEGALRAMPNWELVVLGHNLSLNVLIPAVVIPGIVFTLAALYPFIEEWVTGDRAEHHLLERPRDHPTRTALGTGMFAFVAILMINGANDVVADRLRLSLNQITWITRITIFVVPVFVFFVTKRICLGLQRRDYERLLHGEETGRIIRSLEGEYSEAHEPLDPAQRWVLAQSLRARPPRAPQFGPDSGGIPHPDGWRRRLRSRLIAFYFGDEVELRAEEPLPEAVPPAERPELPGGPREDRPIG